jgi:hypothetical protein
VQHQIQELSKKKKTEACKKNLKNLQKKKENIEEQLKLLRGSLLDNVNEDSNRDGQLESSHLNKLQSFEHSPKSAQDCANDMWAKATSISLPMQSEKSTLRCDTELDKKSSSHEISHLSHFSRIDLTSMRETIHGKEVLSKVKIERQYSGVNIGMFNLLGLVFMSILIC